MTDSVFMGKDIFLKLRMQRILQAQGYHCPLEVALSLVENTDMHSELKRIILTDIDVLCIRFDRDLRKSIVIADCKSGRESEANRMFWLRGVMDFFDANEAFFVKAQLHSPARSLASRLGIRVLDERGLEILEKSLEIEDPKGLAENEDFYRRASGLWGIYVKKGQDPTERQKILKELYQYLEYRYWMMDDYINIQTIMDKFGNVRTDLVTDNLKSKYLAFVGLQRLTLSIIDMASDIAGRNLGDIKRQFRVVFFGGDERMNTSIQMIEYLRNISEYNRLDQKVELEPPYFDELAEIINRLIQKSGHTARILQHLDAVIVEHLFGRKRSLESIMGESYSIEALVLLKRIAAMFCKYTNINEHLLDDLMIL